MPTTQIVKPEISNLYEAAGIGQMNRRSDGLYVLSEDVLENLIRATTMKCMKIIEDVVFNSYSLQNQPTDYEEGWDNGMFSAVSALKQHFSVEDSEKN